MIPPWLWVCGAGVLALSAASVASLFLTTPESAARTYWSLSQIVAGFLALAGAQVVGFYFLSLDTDGVGPTDLILKPLVIWGHTVRQLPHSAPRIWAGVWGATAIFLSTAVIGGIPYEKFWDWGFEQPAESNLLQAIIDEAKKKAAKKKSGGDLEDALNQLQGKKTEAGAGEGTKEPLKTIECLIIGYAMDAETPTKLERLVLAAVVQGKLQCVGSLPARSIPEERQNELLERFSGLERATAFLAAPYEATWLVPRLVCRVKYRKLGERNRLEQPQFDRMMADLDSSEIVRP